MSKDCCIVITTTDSRKTAELIAQKLIENKLAACVQLDEVQSFFIYEGEGVKQGKEIRLFIKAPSDNYGLIERAIKLDHNYQLPQIVKIDITAGSQEYLGWVCSL